MITSTQLQRISGMLDVILDEYDKKPEDFRLMIRTYFTALIGMLSRYYLSNSGRSENKALWIAESITYLEEHTTPMDYVIRRRLDYSCTLLRDASLPIQHVALESGFRDQNYYARQFRKMYRCTPTEYREKQQQLTLT